MPLVFPAERGVTNRPGSGVHLGCGLRGPSLFVLPGLFGRVLLGGPSGEQGSILQVLTRGRLFGEQGSIPCSASRIRETKILQRF